MAISLAVMAGSAIASPASPNGKGDGLSPRYVIEGIEVKGNVKTRERVVLRALTIKRGQVLSVDDPRFELSRYRLLSLGYFSDVRFRLRRGSKRGRVILIVDVRERGTILLTELFFGVSEATAAWGGLGVAERNLLGRGISLDGAFVFGADPKVERGTVQQAYWLRVTAPRMAKRSLELSASFLFLDGNEFFKQRGAEGDSDPNNYLSIRYRRIGGTLSAAFDASRYVRMMVDYRVEAVNSDVPAGAVRRQLDGNTEPIDFGIRRGDSRLSNLALHIERDTRSNPVTPTRGGLLRVGAELSTSLLGSTYDYLKLSASYRHYFPLRWGHVISPQVRGGVIFGEAPFFEKFFIGDFNDLVASRVLGLNFSTLPSRDFFGTSIDSKRYEDFALRLSVEYIVPWFRGGSFFYSGDFFVNVGLIFLTSKEGLQLRDRPMSESVPVDMTLDAGLRLDSRIGIFRISLGNGLGRIPF